MNIMAGHVVNALQQATGLSVAVPIVGEKNLRSAFVQLARGRSSTIAEMCERSAFMRARLTDRSYEYQSAIERAASGEGLEVKKVDGALNKLVAFDSKLEPARDWIGRHAYFFQTAIQFPIDTIVWTAAYNKAIADGMTDADAAAFGDSVVRTTQSDFSPENIANIEAGSALSSPVPRFLQLLRDAGEPSRQPMDVGEGNEELRPTRDGCAVHCLDSVSFVGHHSANL